MEQTIDHDLNPLIAVYTEHDRNHLLSWLLDAHVCPVREATCDENGATSWTPRWTFERNLDRYVLAENQVVQVRTVIRGRQVVWTDWICLR